MSRDPCILFVDDDAELLRAWQKQLKREPCRVLTSTTYDGALVALKAHTVHVVVADLRLNGHSGVDLLELLRSTHPHCVRVLVTGYDVTAADRRRADPWRVVGKERMARSADVIELVSAACALVRKKTDEHPAVPSPAVTWEEQSTPTAETAYPRALTEDTAKRAPLTIGTLLWMVATLVLVVGASAAGFAWIGGQADASMSKHEGRKFAKAHDGAAKRIAANSATIHALAAKLSVALESLRVQVVKLQEQVASLRTLIQTRGRRRRRSR